MKPVPYNQYLKEVDEHLKGGVFLTTGHDKINTMIIGWGGVNIYWGKPIFIVPVRKSRHTHNIIEQTGEFTVSIPMGKDLSSAINFCGTKSGRDYDKFKECGLTATPAQKINTPIIGECTLHYECKVVYKQDLIPENLQKDIHEKWYPDYHTLYFGEIIACYETNDSAD
jgi:flavin reductase (DIM6/NTAB) family NADH-FMN oxidoreductase RutF